MLVPPWDGGRRSLVDRGHQQRSMLNILLQHNEPINPLELTCPFMRTSIFNIVDSLWFLTDPNLTTWKNSILYASTTILEKFMQPPKGQENTIYDMHVKHFEVQNEDWEYCTRYPCKSSQNERLACGRVCVLCITHYLSRIKIIASSISRQKSLNFFYQLLMMKSGGENLCLGFEATYYKI